LVDLPLVILVVGAMVPAYFSMTV